jgi:hypothetical protein
MEAFVHRQSSHYSFEKGREALAGSAGPRHWQAAFQSRNFGWNEESRSVFYVLYRCRAREVEEFADESRWIGGAFSLPDVQTDSARSAALTIDRFMIYKHIRNLLWDGSIRATLL